MLRKHLRSFENQISNIIRRTKGKWSMLKFHQFYSAKKYPKGWAKVSKTILPQLKTAKNPSSSTENRKNKQKIEGKNFLNFFQKFSEIFPKYFRKIFLKVTGNFFEVA